MNVFDTFATVTYEPNIPQVGWFIVEGWVSVLSLIPIPVVCLIPIPMMCVYIYADSVWLVCVHGPLSYTLGTLILTFLFDDPLPTHAIIILQVGQELQERKKTELERLFLAIDNYMT